MREILFRGKRVDNGEWVEGYLFVCWGRAYILWGMEGDHPMKDEVFPETIGQYIGKEDKNGKKIFEGDIFIFLYPWGKIHGRVGFSRKNVGFYLYDKNFELMPGMEDCDNMKVVGNKFDTPELWEEKKNERV